MPTAGRLAAGGHLADLNTATDICETALATRSNSTHDRWTRLQSRRNQLAGRAQHLTTRPSGKLNDNDNGDPIPLRRHHPDNPHRARPARFLRQ